MTKNKFKIVAILLVVLLSLTITFSYASDSEAVPISSESEGQEQTGEEDVDDDANSSLLTSQPEIIQDDIYSITPTQTISKVVNGNTFLIGKDVTISSEIYGNVFVIADNFTIDATGYVAASVFVLANKVTIDGVIYDLYASCSDLLLSEDAIIYRDLKAIGDTINIQGRIGKNVTISANTFTLKTDDAENTVRIYGNLNYSSKEEIQIPEGLISGEVSFEALKEYSPTMGEKVYAYVSNLLQDLLFIAVLFGLAIWLTPKALEHMQKTGTQKLLPAIGVGILAIIVIPIIALLCMFTEFTALIGFAILSIFLLMLCISYAIGAIVLGQFVAKKLKVTKGFMTFLIVLATTLVLWILKQIPYVNLVVSLILVIAGFGIMIMNLLNRKKIFKDSNEVIANTVENKKEEE